MLARSNACRKLSSAGSSSERLLLKVLARRYMRSSAVLMLLLRCSSFSSFPISKMPFNLQLRLDAPWWLGPVGCASMPISLHSRATRARASLSVRPLWWRCWDFSQKLFHWFLRYVGVASRGPKRPADKGREEIVTEQ